MNFITKLISKYRNKTKIICCYYNYNNNNYRYMNFINFIKQIEDKDFLIMELCVDDQLPALHSYFEYTNQLSNYRFIRSNSKLWHKETLLNRLIDIIPEDYQNVIWLDTDIMFLSATWYEDTVAKLKTNNVVQLFEQCHHLSKEKTDEYLRINNFHWTRLNTSTEFEYQKSFCSNYNPRIIEDVSFDSDYNVHGHVGFAWACKLNILKKVNGLYDTALIGGADHIIAHAAAGHINHSCIRKAFLDADTLNSIESYSRKFADLVNKKVSYTPGKILHLWHGDLNKRQYLKRIQETSEMFTPKKLTKTSDGLWQLNEVSSIEYFNTYMRDRENVETMVESNSHITNDIIEISFS